MSNPYENHPSQDPNQGQSQPYGGPIPSGGGYGSPHGGGPGGPGGPGGYGGDLPKKTDAVSITGFVLSLTCCLSVVGFVLGLIGLKRTKGNQRKGRWAAISATVIGILGTLAAVGIGAAIFIFANSVISVDEAKVGQCANVGSEDSNSVVLTDKDCGDDHDAEITYTGAFADVEGLEVAPSNPDDFTDEGSSLLICTALMDPADVETLGDAVDYQYVTSSDDPSGDDPVLCYAERSDGEKFTSKQLP